jgi:hypothetical protein
MPAERLSTPRYRRPAPNWERHGSLQHCRPATRMTTLPWPTEKSAPHQRASSGRAVELKRVNPPIVGIAYKRGLGRDDFKVDARLLRRGLLDNGYSELPIQLWPGTQARYACSELTAVCQAGGVIRASSESCAYFPSSTLMQGTSRVSPDAIVTVHSVAMPRILTVQPTLDALGSV